MFGGLTCDKARPNGDGAGDHARASGAFLTGAQPKKTAGANFQAGQSADQVAAKQLGDKTRLPSLELAIDRIRNGNRLFDVCGTVEQHVKANGFSIVREFVGHGIGTQLHEEPQVPNFVDRKNENPRLKEGMVLAVEPMVNAGRPEAVVLKDKWTAVTKDGSNSAHFEHCIAVTENGPWVLTRP